MGGECEKCGEHAVQCECEARELGEKLLNTIWRKWVSKEEVLHLFPEKQAHFEVKLNETESYGEWTVIDEREGN